jgi:hypothetical protein
MRGDMRSERRGDRAKEERATTETPLEMFNRLLAEVESKSGRGSGSGDPEKIGDTRHPVESDPFADCHLTGRPRNAQPSGGPSDSDGRADSGDKFLAEARRMLKLED